MSGGRSRRGAAVTRDGCCTLLSFLLSLLFFALPRAVCLGFADVEVFKIVIVVLDCLALLDELDTSLP